MIKENNIIGFNYLKHATNTLGLMNHLENKLIWAVFKFGNAY